MIYVIYADEGPKNAARDDYSQAWLRLIKVSSLDDVRSLQKSIDNGHVSGRKNARIIAFFSEDSRDRDFGAEFVVDWSKKISGSRR